MHLNLSGYSEEKPRAQGKKGGKGGLERERVQIKLKEVFFFFNQPKRECELRRMYTGIRILFYDRGTLDLLNILEKYTTKVIDIF